MFLKRRKWTGPCTLAAFRRAIVAGLPTKEKDPRKSLHVDDVATPELGPGEALIAVMASAINYNTVWTSIFEPLPTFGFLERKIAFAKHLATDLVEMALWLDLDGVELTGRGDLATTLARFIS